ncbi:MAG TPA: 4Fe-4S binding protein [Thermoleophilia bacterium]|nr:4Fe-4S binding protein [Thermoleophilia bacterium]
MRRRRRDGSGRGACLDPHAGAAITDSGTAAVIASAPVADVPAHAAAVVSRGRTVAIVAEPESCIACGTCVETCPRGAITVEEIAAIDPQLCNGCGMCIDDCSYGALALSEV